MNQNPLESCQIVLTKSSKHCKLQSRYYYPCTANNSPPPTKKKNISKKINKSRGIPPDRKPKDKLLNSPTLGSKDVWAAVYRRAPWLTAWRPGLPRALPEHSYMNDQCVAHIARRRFLYVAFYIVTSWSSTPKCGFSTREAVNFFF